MPVNYKNWKFTRKVIRITHNREVKKYFKNLKTDADSKTYRGASSGREAIRDCLLIYENDSAMIVANKQMFFTRLTAAENSVLSYPESWIIHSGTDIPQLKIIYRTNSKERKGYYDLNIPHYKGSKSIKPPKYTKGNQPVIFNLKDRTKIVINAVSENEGKSVIRYFLRFVDDKFIKDKDNFVLGSPSKVKRDEMTPIRADYYPHGQNVANPQWRIYF